jgi:carboxypeptidase C (cathepsin A)
MRYLRDGEILLWIALGMSLPAWGQGGNGRAGGRAAAAQSQTPAPASAPAATTTPAPATAPAPGGAAGRGGRGGAAGGATDSFFNYDPTATSGAAIPDAPPTETHQKITVNGETFSYTARVGYMALRNATTGQSEAHLFYTFYAKDGVSDAPARPVLFFLGGAPGVAAAWQEFGGLGPKRMKWANDGEAGQPPYGWVDNPGTPLGQADLVFVNAVGAAFSRADQPARAPNFWTTAGDIASLAEFVRSFLNTNNRRNSPLYLAGEDFATARAAGLATYLIEHQIPVHGVALLSMTMTADALAGDEEFMTQLPSLTMAAWSHKKLAPELESMSAEKISDQARQFASREYLHALYKGDRMTAAERTAVIANMSRLTGLSKAFVVNNNLRIPLDRFTAELLREEHRGLSNSDARVSGFTPTAGGGRGGGGGGGGFGGRGGAAIDFSESNLAGGFQAAYEAYLRQELGFNGNGVFYLSSGGVGAFTPTGSDDASLSSAFARNPNLRLFVAENYFDLNAPFYATEFTLAHLSVSPEVRAKNIVVNHYEAGQRTYVDGKALTKLQGDLAKFIAQPAAPASK